MKGGLFGHQSGYNFQRGNFVFGYISDAGVYLGNGEHSDRSSSSETPDDTGASSLD